MDLTLLKVKLLAAARRPVPSDAVPHGFEQRVMARLRAPGTDDVWMLWGRMLWRGALGCAAIALLLSLWALLPLPAEPRTSLSDIYDSTVYMAADELTDSW